MWVVVEQFEVLEAEVVDLLYLPVKNQCRYFTRLTGKLEINLFQMVAVDVTITTGPDELQWFHVHDLSDHFGEDRIAGDVEGYAEENVR